MEHRPCFYAGHCAKVTVPFSSEAITASDSRRTPAARTSALLLLFNDDAAASALRARLPHDVDEAQQRLSPGEEIVQDEHSVLRAEKFFG